MAALPPGFLIQDIVQAFPVTGTETAAACRLKIDIWKNMLQSGAGFFAAFFPVSFYRAICAAR